MQTLNLTEAAKFLKMHPVTLQGKVKTGEIPGAKPGKSWVFIVEDLANYIRSLYTKDGKWIGSQNGNNKCSLNEIRPGVTNSRSVEKQYTDLLAQQTKQKPKK